MESLKNYIYHKMLEAEKTAMKSVIAIIVQLCPDQCLFEALSESCINISTHTRTSVLLTIFFASNTKTKSTVAKWTRTQFLVKWGPSPAEWGPKKRMFSKLIETSKFVEIKPLKRGENCSVIELTNWHGIH